MGKYFCETCKLFDDDAEGPTEGTKGPPGAMIKHEDSGGHDAAEEADGHEENQHSDEPTRTKQAKPTNKKVGKKVAHKREASQGTLDGMVTRKKKKDAETSSS